eukprot:1225024-Pleurochrysis_carterae.AAC.1
MCPQERMRTRQERRCPRRRARLRRLVDDDRVEKRLARRDAAEDSARAVRRTRAHQRVHPCAQESVWQGQCRATGPPSPR